jgi:hypothetical protein
MVSDCIVFSVQCRDFRNKSPCIATVTHCIVVITQSILALPCPQCHVYGIDTYSIHILTYSKFEYSHTQLTYSHTQFRYSHTQFRYSHTQFEYSHTQFEYSHTQFEYSHTQFRYSHTQFEYSHTHFFILASMTPPPIISLADCVSACQMINFAMMVKRIKDKGKDNRYTSKRSTKEKRNIIQRSGKGKGGNLYFDMILYILVDVGRLARTVTVTIYSYHYAYAQMLIQPLCHSQSDSWRVGIFVRWERWQ